MKRITFFTLLLHVAAVHAAHAAPAFSQLPLDEGVSFAATLNGQIADDFVISSDALIAGIQWWGGEGFPPAPVADTFSIRFFYDSGSGSPALAPFLTLPVADPFRTQTAFYASRGQPIFQYVSSLPQLVPLTGGETYYLSILSQTTDNWGWAASNYTGASWVRDADGVNWEPRVSPSADLAFALHPVPAPPALALFFTSLFSLPLFSMSRRNR